MWKKMLDPFSVITAESIDQLFAFPPTTLLFANKFFPSAMIATRIEQHSHSYYITWTIIKESYCMHRSNHGQLNITR